jgi:hypothetical protein
LPLWVVLEPCWRELVSAASCTTQTFSLTLSNELPRCEAGSLNSHWLIQKRVWISRNQS